MKIILQQGPFAILYAAAGAAYLWVGTTRGIGFYPIAGICFLALAAWEVWTIFRRLRTGRTGWPGWPPTLNLGYVILTLCQIYRCAIEPTDFNIALAAGWSVIGAVWAFRFVREFRAAAKKKEELS